MLYAMSGRAAHFAADSALALIRRYDAVYAALPIR